MKEAGTLSTLEQIKVMAHPLRMKLLEAFSHKPITTKQVAAQLAERSTRLYHHVDALERVGLIKLVRTSKKRGTVEKYYQTVARTFAVDRRLFTLKHQARAAQSGMLDVITGIFEDTLSEIHQNLAARLDKPKADEKRIIVSHSHIRVTQKDVAGLDQQIKALLKKSETGEHEAGAVDYGYTLALYPVRKSKRRISIKNIKKGRKK
ncbi:MAG: helix-turn-helix transcriptional regulator [candidate division WOR-3 bacterium]|nr:MAG: helix-turn-helix transcriptional regulator [candidate division WOR-3 bacterium]